MGDGRTDKEKKLENCLEGKESERTGRKEVEGGTEGKERTGLDKRRILDGEGGEGYRYSTY